MSQLRNRIRHLIWSAPPFPAFSNIRIRGGAFVVWCKGPRKLFSSSPRAAASTRLRAQSFISANWYALAYTTVRHRSAQRFPESLHHTTKAPPRMRTSLNDGKGGALQIRCRPRLNTTSYPGEMIAMRRVLLCGIWCVAICAFRRLQVSPLRSGPQNSINLCPGFKRSISDGNTSSARSRARLVSSS